MSFLKNIISNDSDYELIQQYRHTGDIKVLGELYSRYMEMVYGVCLKYLKEPETAQDAVMNIFEELVSKLSKHEVENFSAWLHQVTKNHCLMRLRSEKRQANVKLDDQIMHSFENEHQEEAWEKETHFEALHYCLEQLSSEQRQMVELFYLKEKCYKEIALTTGLDWNMVRSKIQNGRRNLKICIEKKMQRTTTKL